ncbi:MAG: RagB/SusD family nutrient uptake outer membrane protein [Gemmatimonadaceae bacterium]
MSGEDMRQYLALTLLASGLGFTAGLTGCDLDTTNPNAPTQESAVNSTEGLINIGVGLQARFGSSTGALIYAAGLIGDELGPIGTAFSTISDAEQGIVLPNAGLASDLWASNYRTIKSANDIIFNHENVQMPRGLRSGLVGLAYLLKAAAIGELVQGFEQVAIETYNVSTPEFVERPAALASVIALLDSAQIAYSDTAPTAQFTGSVLVSGFDIRNTIYAYRARYHRLLGNDALALANADSVNRTVFSVIPFNAQNVNPVFANSIGAVGVLPRDIFRTSDASEALRTAFHVKAATITGRDPLLTPLDSFARYNVPTAFIPAYYPDEALLIKAEALVNLGRLVEAQAALDSVRTDCPAAGRVTTDPGPCLPPLAGLQTAQQLLAEIIRNRRYELFATGLRWEDLRRLQLVGATNVAKRCWLPYPIGERNANPANVPADPEGAVPVANPGPCF